MNRLLPLALVAAILLSACAKHPEEAADGEHEGVAHWAYEGGEGPEAWGQLSADWETCSLGGDQSPIDLPGDSPSGAPSLVSDHQPVPASFVFNGHTVQFEGANGGGITVNGHAYSMLQYHVHFPSEHHAGGVSYPGEVHFVHADSSGALAVVGVFFAEGEASEVLAPAIPGLTGMVEGTSVTAAVSIDVDDLIGTGSYRAYSGSLTTPPCSEGVSWFVMDTPVTLSAEQINAFEAVVGQSNRPVQPLGVRTVLSGAIQ